MAEDFEDEQLARDEAGGDALARQMAMGVPLHPASEDYLRKHSRLLDLQIERLRHDEEFDTSHLRWRRFNDQMRGMLQIMAVAIVGLIVVAIGTAVWRAHEDKGVVIEAFSVPPDIAARGLTGQVIAAKLQDRLTALQNATYSFRAPASYANNWGNDIKVQIPDTGVSIGEFNRYLTDWLGNETHIGGEVYRAANGIAVTARAGGESTPTFAGSEAEIDSLVQKTAEAIYRNTQPYRYGVYLFSHDRAQEAKPVLEELIRTGSTEDRSWAYVGLSTLAETDGDEKRALGLFKQATEAKPDNIIAWTDLANTENNLGHDEKAAEAERTSIALGARGGDSDLNPYYRPVALPRVQTALDLAMGDNVGALALAQRVEAMPDRHSWEQAYGDQLLACAAMHDDACERSASAGFPESKDPATLLNREGNRALADALLGHWQDLAARVPNLLAALVKQGNAAATVRDTGVLPLIADADAHLGDFKAADALIAKTPLDCDSCVRIRGAIASAERDWARAAYWFALVSARSRSIPFADTDWGAMLLAKGATGAAIAKFESAHAKGPHFADPLEMWGEALMLKNRSDLALAKFEEANKYAPNWGRLHLKWGDALLYAGRKDEATKQFGIASTLDLSPTDKAALAHARGLHG
jgi:tetratricopeptide (TPR) repeat protein